MPAEAGIQIGLRRISDTYLGPGLRRGDVEVITASIRDK